MKGSHNTNIDTTFYNDRVKEVMDVAIMAEPFTYIPIKAGHMEVVGGNAIVFGKITEGYDVINPIVTTEITYEDISATNRRIDLAINYLQTDIYYEKRLEGSVEITYRIVSGVVTISIPHDIYVGSTYYINVQNSAELLGPITASYLAQAGDTFVEVKAGLQASLIANGVDAADIETIVGVDTIYLFERTWEWQDFPYYESGEVKDIFTQFVITAFVLIDDRVKYPILKCGAMHGFGIVYKDRAGRQCSVMKTSDMTVYIPFYAEETDSMLYTIPRLKFKINHRPPTWAETYEIVYYGNLSMDFFLQIRADDITDLTNDRYSININQTIVDTYIANARWRVPDYVWQTGDRLRLIGTVNVTTGVVTKYDVLYDYEIEETGTQNGLVLHDDWLYIQAVDHPASFAGQTNILVEVYRPHKGLNRSSPLGEIGIAYGSGMVFEIGMDANGNYYHKGDVDQVISATGILTTPAEVENDANDGWKFVRLNYKDATATILPFWAESIYPSDWWDDQTIEQRLTSMGFPFVDDLSLRQQVLDERIRNGGFLITGTRTNNIAHFVYDDYKDLSKRYGDITGLREIGYTLKILQLHKETSIYINRIQTFSADGGEGDFSLSSKLLNTERPMEDDFGCQHPNSIMVNGRNLYYWDDNEGAFIRSAPNGQMVLSGPEYKMQRWFRDMYAWIKISGGAQLLDVNIGANNEHEEVWATWRINTDIWGIIFSEKQGRFVSRLNQITESYLHLGNFFAHLYHQRLWIMNVDEGQKWLYWSGSPVYAEVEVASNIESGKNKVFNAIAQFADHLLQSLSRYIHIPAEASGTYELMETNAPVFELREGIYFGEIMKDVNSKGNFSSEIDRKLNGNEMRGRYCYARFRTEEHDEKVRIDSIAVFSTLSERNV